MKHTSIIFNPATKEWFCANCDRTSGHMILEDARWELNQYECKVPSVGTGEQLRFPPMDIPQNALLSKGFDFSFEGNRTFLARKITPKRTKVKSEELFERERARGIPAN